MADSRVADLVAYGVDRASAEGAFGGQKPGTLGVYRDLWPSVLWLQRLARCWRYGEHGHPRGIDWAQAAGKIGLAVPEGERAGLLERLEVMEEAALSVLLAK